MSTEQKAKAYDEVRERIALRFGSNVAEEIFSEFEMSEDERIRKWLYGYFCSLFATWIHPDITCEEIPAWLEKQGETFTKKDVDNAYIEGMAFAKDELEKQKPTWSEEDKNFMYDTLSNLTELKDRYGEGYGNAGKCIDWLKSLKQRYTWKPNKEQLKFLQHYADQSY